MEMSKISDPRQRKRSVCAKFPKDGVVQLGIMGGMTPLMSAMIASRPEIVSLFLEFGAVPYDTAVSGNDGLMFACMFGRTDNVKFWLDRFPDWDLERKNKVMGGVALGHAVYMGPHRLELVKVLLEYGASCSHCTDLGSSILIALSSSEDADPELLTLLLSKIKSKSVNYMLRGRMLKWRNIHRHP